MQHPDVASPLFRLCCLVPQSHVNTLRCMVQQANIQEESHTTQQDDNFSPLHFFIRCVTNSFYDNCNNKCHRHNNSVEYFQIILEERLPPCENPGSRSSFIFILMMARSSTTFYLSHPDISSRNPSWKNSGSGSIRNFDWISVYPNRSGVVYKIQGTNLREETKFHPSSDRHTNKISKHFKSEDRHQNHWKCYKIYLRKSSIKKYETMTKEMIEFSVLFPLVTETRTIATSTNTKIIARIRNASPSTTWWIWK